VSELLNDKLNLGILESICSGVGVAVNISALAKMFKKHRNTIKSQVNDLFEHKVLNRPIYPFAWLYREFSLLVLVRADLPRNEAINTFLTEDENIFAAFFVRDESYNTLIVEFHKDVFTYGEWRKRIVREKKIPPRDIRYPADALFFSTQQIVKYQPYSPIQVIEKRYANGESLEVNGYRMNKLGFQIAKELMLGAGIRTNENLLAQELDVHRKTIERRLSVLLREKIIEKPVCRFPNFFVPPNHVLICNLFEIKKSQDKLLKAIKDDPRIPLAIEANIGKHNMLLFKVFRNIEEHFQWEAEYDSRFPGCIGSMKKMFLSPQMTVSIDQQKVSLGIIKRRKELLRGRELIETVR
jgi:DNA-binding HxlR family transcriptional regulator